jgi:aspartyl-tRNA(Asn)/glutamyl-tRNA(Gln) amidotransferase subunit B
MTYEAAIGLEIHVELKTKTKMFCNCPNDPDERHPNFNICPICSGHPGTLPVINKEAVEKLLKVGLALNSQVAEFSKFDRKNYFYPDLPKGYQISQYDLPLCRGGYLDISEGKRINIERIHLEEDTGRLIHPVRSRPTSLEISGGMPQSGKSSKKSLTGLTEGTATITSGQSASNGVNSEKTKYTLVDFNRAGVPLMELVTKPDLKSGREIEKFAKELQLILRYLEASNADMEKGEMRIEVNLSMKEEGAKELGTKVEIKNINSIKAAAAAADFEIKRQTEKLKKGEKIIQETRGWDENKGATFSQRVKEGSADYRYFPEPDLPPIKFSKDEIEELRLSLPELPAQRRERFKRQYGLTNAQIEIFTIAKNFGDYYENVASELDLANKDSRAGEKNLAKLHALAANYMITEFPPLLNMQGMEINELEGIKITPEAFAELMVMVFHRKLSSTNAKIVLKEMAETGLHPSQIVKEKELEQTSDIEEISRAVDEIIAKNPKAVEDYKKGKTEALKFLTGQVMALTRGRANPQLASQLLEQKLVQSD